MRWTPLSFDVATMESVGCATVRGLAPIEPTGGVVGSGYPGTNQPNKAAMGFPPSVIGTGRAAFSSSFEGLMPSAA